MSGEKTIAGRPERPLTVDQIVQLRNQGVTAEYVLALRYSGYEQLSVEELLDLRRSGVTLEYIAEMAELGYERLPVNELARMRRHGVTPEYVREMRSEGYGDATRPSDPDLAKVRTDVRIDVNVRTG